MFFSFSCQSSGNKSGQSFDLKFKLLLSSNTCELLSTGRWFLVRSIFNTFLEWRLQLLIMKRKRPEEIALNSMAHIEENRDLEGKKTLFEDINLFKAKKIWKETWRLIRLDSLVLLSLQW